LHAVTAVIHNDSDGESMAKHLSENLIKTASKVIPELSNNIIQQYAVTPKFLKR